MLFFLKKSPLKLHIFLVVMAITTNLWAQEQDSTIVREEKTVTDLPPDLLDSVQMTIPNWREVFIPVKPINEPLELIFSLKFRGITTYEIVYIPKNNCFNLFNQKRSASDSLYSLLSDSTLTLDLIHENYIINHPSEVNELWDEIPEPQKLLERGFMKRVSASAELKKSLHKISDEERKQLVIKKAKFSPWKFEGVEYLQLQQTGHVNWQSGGENNVTFVNDLRMKLIYKKDKLEWESYSISKMGITVNDQKEVEINNDLLELNSKIGYKATKNWFYSANANLKTQLFYNVDNNADGTKTYKSGFLSPGYYTAGIGMDYKPSEKFSLLLSPLTSKITFVADTFNIDPSNYNIKPGNKSIRQVGFSINTNFTIPITALIDFNTRLELFKDYIEKYNSWYFYMENILDVKVNRYLNARVDLQWRYSEIEIAALQFVENIQIGFTYNF